MFIRILGQDGIISIISYIKKEKKKKRLGINYKIKIILDQKMRQKCQIAAK